MSTATCSVLVIKARRSGAVLVTASCLLGIAGYGFYCGLPVILGAISDSRGIPAADLGWVASGEILGLLMGGLAATWIAAWMGPRRMAIAGVLLVAGAHLASLSAALGLGGLIVARLIGGFGGGAIYAIGVSSLAATPHPGKSVAIFSGVLALGATIEVGVLPLIIPHGGITGVFLVLLAIALVGLPLVGALPAGHKSSSAARVLVKTTSRISGSSWVMLAGMACFHVAPVIYWTYGERIGVGSGIPETTLGLAFTISGILGALACFGSEPLARRIGQSRSLQLITALLIMGLLSWLFGRLTPIGYILRACLVGIPWVLGGVFQVNVANEIDPSGRLSALVGPAQNVGLMLGPAIASTLLGAGQSFPVVLSVATAFLVLSMILSVAGHRRSRRSID